MKALETSTSSTMSSESESAQVERQKQLQGAFDVTKLETYERGMQSQRAQGMAIERSGMDGATTPASEAKGTTQSPPSVSSIASSSKPKSKHHCLISGHIFKHYRISRLPPEVEIDGLVPPSQHSKHKQEDLRVYCMVCRGRMEEHFWKCTVPICLREVCGECRNRLDWERANDAKATWSGGG